ncbi:hypothetical protein [Phaeobacter gallaeciensis]|jgi:hypothetical protein|uniref:ACT domain-containing protein n=1 Tax=Phaeobacter gallaeciensis TaxID=60890 RepID=A0ABD4XEB5_9RHOB|nr:hypothetical protein [Phaeobacter gallaeciensis]MDE4142224.1 hypothetical protein [Phaeobacter gallaeciensis]MDE4146580.1 hypothetical protein [Phaeobacter gallaeciensis]MDE4150653.1 hypothetical protein [Phaeobacter gallaeciensis]MDE4154832.1 hypothetical protein [Phaeobacter gallaeciensis]MDE4159278.1 hypothetical protein [Phaeobacter gallaeciensis]
MQGFLRCSDPLGNMCRVADTARRMGMSFSLFKLEKHEADAFALTFTLDEQNAQKVTTFAQRIGLYIDLTEEIVDV